HPDCIFIGCEPYINGVANLLKLIKDANLQNILIWPDDGRILLQHMPANILDRIYLLFPDPWPKKKHHKKRIVNQNWLNLCASKLKSTGDLAIATDHADYAKWITRELT